MWRIVNNLNKERNESSILIKIEFASIEIYFKPRFTINLKYIENY